MKYSIALICLCLLITEAAAVTTKQKHSGLLHDWLQFFEGTFIRLIWLNLTWYGFYAWLPSIVCTMGLSDIIFDAMGTSVPGIDTAAAKIATKTSAEKTCKDGFKTMYDAVWYFNGEKVFVDGDLDYYNYVPGKE